MKKLHFILIVFITFLIACNNKTQPISNDALKTIITKKYVDFEAAMKYKKADFFIDLYTKNSVFYHVNRNTFGNDSIANDFKAMMQANIVISCKPVDVEVYGDSAFEIGNATITKNDSLIAKERYIVIWKKVNNQWKIDKDIPIKTK